MINFLLFWNDFSCSLGLTTSYRRTIGLGAKENCFGLKATTKFSVLYLNYNNVLIFSSIFYTSGKMITFLRITDYKTNSKIEFEGDMYLLPRIVCKFKELPEKPTQTQVTVEIYSRRQSALFQVGIYIFKFIFFLN